MSATRVDPVTQYARRVVAGKIVTGTPVRHACERHLRDLKESVKRGIKFHVEQALDAINFFPEVLRLSTGKWEALPFVLLDWEAFVVGSIFGWLRDDGTRRFRMAYVETAKGSGKSPVAAGIGLYMLVADREDRAEVYAAATKKDQAKILFRDAIAMVRQSPVLLNALQINGSVGNEYNLAYHSRASFFRVISSDDSQSGPRPHCALVDEMHEHKTAGVLDMLDAGKKSREQPLVFVITNAGVDKKSPCGAQHEYAKRVASGQESDDEFFSYVCALDKGDDPLNDESVWEKTNPSLSVGLPGYDYIRGQVTKARGMPSKESVVMRLNFCEWVQAHAPWLSADVWMSARDAAFDPARLAGRRCWGGLDLSSTQDLTALVLIFEPTDDDPFYRQRSYFWIPGDRIAEKEKADGVEYKAWIRAGYVEAPKGRAIDKRAVLARTVAICSAYDVESIGYDRHRMEDLLQLMSDEGHELPIEPFGQGYASMAPAVDEYERLLINRELKHDNNACMTWNAANAVVDMDPAGNRKLNKRRAVGRIDGAVAGVMAAGMSCKGAGESDTAAQAFVAL